MHGAGLALVARQGLVDHGLSDQATLDGQEAMAGAPDEPEGALLAGAEAHMIAVAERFVGADDLRDGLNGELADSPQLLADDVALELQLTLIADVLPLAAAA